MSDGCEPRATRLVMVSPDEALKLARPLPSADELAIDGLTFEEWNAFIDALASR